MFWACSILWAVRVFCEAHRFEKPKSVAKKTSGEWLRHACLIILKKEKGDYETNRLTCDEQRSSTLVEIWSSRNR